MARESIRKAGSAGLVPTTAATNGDLLHALGTGRTARITKILAYNNTGANVPLLFGTRDRSVAPLLVQLLPDLVVVNGFDNEWVEAEIPAVEFIPNLSLLAVGRLGDIYVVAGTVAIPVVGVIISIEVEEYGS